MSKDKDSTDLPGPTVAAGVATAIYLHEYASPTAWGTRIVRIAVNNLAGVPSIVFGLFGLGFFVQFVGGGMDKLFYGGDKVFGQPAFPPPQHLPLEDLTAQTSTPPQRPQDPSSAG